MLWSVVRCPSHPLWPASLLAMLLLASCQSISSRDPTSIGIEEECEMPGACAAGESSRRWRIATDAEQRARKASKRSAAAAHWLTCSINAYPGWHAQSPSQARMAAALATRCADGLIRIEGQHRRGIWASGPLSLGGRPAIVEMRGWSAAPLEPLRMALAADVSMAAYGGRRFTREGFGVPLAMVWPRCEDSPACKLLPPEGSFRNATAWVEPRGEEVRLIIADPNSLDSVRFGPELLQLSRDTSAAHAMGIARSPLLRIGILGLVGGREAGRRSGLYLLEDYDPKKQPVVMIHGLGSSPLVWARLSNAIWGDPTLASRYQVWHLVYQTNAPLLATRFRIQNHLDEAWNTLDPEGDDDARYGAVLVGHSLGGVLSRLLVSRSGDVLWNAAFTVGPDALNGTPADLALIRAVFHFEPYPGVTAAVFLAAPHRGAPAAGSWWGRLARVLVGRRAPEVQVVRRVAQQQPEAIVTGLRETYLGARLNSISTLQTFQPVRAAGESILPVEAVRYHSIIAVTPGRHPPSDGAVPVKSAEIDGAASTRYVVGGHDVPQNEDAIAEVLRILHESLSEGPPKGQRHLTREVLP